MKSFQIVRQPDIRHSIVIAGGQQQRNGCRQSLKMGRETEKSPV